MKKIKKARSAIILLVTLWLLSGISIISIAENIPLSEDRLEKIGLNKIRLEGGIGAMIFDLSESYDQLEASGCLVMSNTYNSSITISCRVITKLSTIDLDENGAPRIHKKVSDNIIFKPFPTDSWITLEENKAVINPCSIYNFRYTVNIDIEYLREQIMENNNIFNTSEGYLAYINIKKDSEDTTGMNIRIDYNYKLFIMFTGELKQEKQEGYIFDGFLLLIIPISITMGGLFLLHQKNKSKKATPNTTSVHANENIPRKTYKERPILDEDVMRQRIDDILRGKGG